MRAGGDDALHVTIIRDMPAIVVRKWHRMRAESFASQR